MTKIIIFNCCFAFLVLLLIPTPAFAALSAFPGAEGFGANTPGGRGGQVVEVTNLNDSGTGSLRACVEANGPRTCVFRIGGTITLNTSLKILNPYITIAGQTAPGGGITLRNNPDINKHGTIIIQTHDVILRYFRIRTGATKIPACCDQSLTVTSGYNIIADHLSTSWSTDQTITLFTDPKTGSVQDITVQWSFITEGLFHSTNSKPGGHSTAAIFGSTNIGNISFHHNLLAHNDARNPRVGITGILDVVNNVVYNYGRELSYADAEHGSSALNYIGNFIKKGPSSTTNNRFVKVDPFAYTILVFVQGNIDRYRTNNSLPDNLSVDLRDQSYIVSTKAPAPLVTTYPCNSMTDCEVYTHVLADAGANKYLDDQGNFIPRLDAVDKRILEEVKRGEGKIIDATSFSTMYSASASAYLAPTDYTKYGITDPIADDGWPILEAGIAPADSDHDGMPDTWEDKYEFDKNNAVDSNQDIDGDGYTNIEEFLNSTQPHIPENLPPISLTSLISDWLRSNSNYEQLFDQKINSFDFAQALLNL